MRFPTQLAHWGDPARQTTSVAPTGAANPPAITTPSPRRQSLQKPPIRSNVFLFDDDDHVLNVVLLLSLTNQRDGCPEVTGLMLERLRLDE